MRPPIEWFRDEATEQDIDDLFYDLAERIAKREGSDVESVMRRLGAKDIFSREEIVAISDNHAAGEWRDAANDLLLTARYAARTRRAVKAVRKARPAKRRGR
jgi:hypothetical protein